MITALIVLFVSLCLSAGILILDVRKTIKDIEKDSPEDLDDMKNNPGL